MKNILAVLILLSVTILAVVPGVHADVFSACGTISTPGYYVLDQDITTTNTCVTITSSDVDLDCNGHSITYASTGTATRFGVDATLGVSPLSNITVRNCLIQKTSALNTAGYGIRLQRTSNSYIYNNTVWTNGTTNNYGLYLVTSANNNVIENNTIVARGTSTGNNGIYIVSDSNNNNVFGNSVTSYGTTTSYALFVSTDANDNTFYNNSFSSITTSGSGNTDMHTINVFSSKRNDIINNIIYSQGVTRNYAAYFNVNANNNSIANNIIINNGSTTTNYGIYALNSRLNIIVNNTVSTYGTGTDYGIYHSGEYDGIVANNTVYASGSGASNYGIYLIDSLLIDVVGNNITTNGTTTNYGIPITTSSYNTIRNNTIRTLGTGATNTGILLTTSIYNTIEGNQISTSGTSANAGIFLTTASNENVIANNTILASGSTTTNYGIYATQSQFNDISENDISTTGTTTNYGIHLITQANRNILRNNLVSVNGTTTNYGIYLSTSSYNVFIGTNVSTNGTTRSGTTNNWGIYLTTNSNENEFHNGSVTTDGAGSNYGVYLLTDSDRNIVRGNSIHSGGDVASNIGLLVTASSKNTLQDNIISTSGTATNYGIELFSSASYNVVKNNTLTTSGGGNSYGFYLLFSTPNYPQYNNLSSNTLASIDGTELRVGTASIDGIGLIDQPINTYLFTGTGSLVIIENSTAGKIKFTDRLTGSGSGLSGYINITENLVSGTSSVSGFNKSAEITIYNRPTTLPRLQILRDGYPCSASICTNLTSMQAGNVTFNITSWSSYSIQPVDATPQVITLSSPVNNSNISTSSYSFNFSVTDELSLNFSCNLFIDSVIGGINDTVFNATLANIHATGISGGSHLWNVTCFDEGNNSVTSETRLFQNLAPSVILDSPANNSYLNGVSSTILNITVADNDLSNATVWFYGDGSLLNTTNLDGATEATTLFEGLSLGVHNWSVIVSDGISNASSDTYLFSVIDLSIACEAGGPYQTDALEIIYGNVSDGTVALTLQSVNLSLFYNGAFNSSYLVNTNAGGSYQSTFSSLPEGNYTINASTSYLGFNGTCSDDFSVVAPGGGVATSASLVLDKIVSLQTLNATTVVYAINLGVTNAGGSTATSAVLHDDDFTGSPYAFGTLGAGETNSTLYNLSYTRNSTTYTVNLSIAYINATDALTNSEIQANSSALSLVIPATSSNASLVLTKNAQFTDSNATSVSYNVSLQLTNAGGTDLTDILLNDSDLGINVSLNLNRTQSYSNSALVSINKNTTAQTRTFWLANATISGVSYYSNQLSLLIPPLDSNASLVLSREFSAYLLNSTTAVYNATLTLTNAGGRNLTSTMLYDYNSTNSPYIIGTMTPGETITRSYLISFARTSSTQSITFIAATANGTDSLSGNLVEASSSTANIVVPSSNSPASFVLDKIISFYNLTNGSIFYNVSLRLTNRGGTDATNVTINDSDSPSSPYSLGTIAAGSTNTTSYLINYTRNSTTYTVNLGRAQAYGNDSTSLELINSNSSTLSLTVPASTPDTLLTLVKNAQYNSENSTAVNYTLSLEVVNSGGTDLASISVIDSDLDLTTTISLNRTQTWSYNGTIIITKAASNAEEDFVAATATVGGTVYESNEVSVLIPGYGGPADAIVYAPQSVNASESFDSIIQVLNMNEDIGQDFTIDYWITNNDETTNYSSGQRTIYVASLGQTNTTVTLTAPSTNGTYRLRGLVSWVGGTATTYDSFEVGETDSTNETQDSSSSSSTGSGSGGGTITGNSVNDQKNPLCEPPLIPYGDTCCDDVNNNGVCDRNEKEAPIQNNSKDINRPTNSSTFADFAAKFFAWGKKAAASIKAEIDNSSSFVFPSIIVILLVTVLTVLLSHNKNKIVAKQTTPSLNKIIGKTVYSNHGDHLGKVKEAYIDHEGSRLYGWVIKLNKKYSHLTKKKLILVKPSLVESIGDAMLLKGAVVEHLDKFSLDKNLPK